MEYNEKSLVIGLDLGGTNSVFGIVDKVGARLGIISKKTKLSINYTITKN